MIDIKFLRENPDIVKQNIKNKFQDDKLPLVDEVIEFDAKSRQAKQDADALRASRKSISKEIGALMAQGKKEEAEAKKAEVSKNAEKLDDPGFLNTSALHFISSIGCSIQSVLAVQFL